MPVTFYGKSEIIFPMAESHEDAVKLAAWVKTPGVSPALIGSVQGETLEGHVELAVNEGSVGVSCVAGWNTDGSSQWKYLMFD